MEVEEEEQVPVCVARAQKGETSTRLFATQKPWEDHSKEATGVSRLRRRREVHGIDLLTT